MSRVLIHLPLLLLLTFGALAENKDYKFTTDWVSWNVKNWEKHLSHFKGQDKISALEIGAFEGRSTVWFLENILTGPSSKITVIDVWEAPDAPHMEKFFDHNMKEGGFLGKIIKLKGYSENVLRELPTDTGYDFMYIDGCHTAVCVLSDIVHAWSHLKIDGIMILDDYEWEGKPPKPLVERPKPAIDAFLFAYGPYLTVLHKEYQVIIQKKKHTTVTDGFSDHTIKEIKKNSP